MKFSDEQFKRLAGVVSGEMEFPDGGETLHKVRFLVAEENGNNPFLATELEIGRSGGGLAITICDEKERFLYIGIEDGELIARFYDKAEDGEIIDDQKILLAVYPYFSAPKQG